MFKGASSFDGTIGSWDTKGVRNMTGLFSGAVSFTGWSGVLNWNTKAVEDFSYTFSLLPNFNENVGGLSTNRCNNMQSMFQNCTSFQGAGLENFITHRVTNMQDMFSRNYALESPDLSSWDVSRLITARGMFSYCFLFNTDTLESWETASLEDASYMFVSATSFDGSLSGWNVTSVTSLEGFMLGARAFNQDSFSSWTSTDNLQDLSLAFSLAKSFNQPVPFQTSSVTSFKQMFDGAEAFNQQVNFDLSSATELTHMFRDAVTFDQSVSSFNVQGVDNLSGMFQGAANFSNGGDYFGMRDWQTENVVDMSSLFEGTNGDWDLSNWQVGRVQNFARMFANNPEFVGDSITGWNGDTARAEDLSSMFDNCTSFQGNVSFFDTGRVRNMNAMFRGAENFNSDISGWGKMVVLDRFTSRIRCHD